LKAPETIRSARKPACLTFCVASRQTAFTSILSPHFPGSCRNGLGAQVGLALKHDCCMNTLYPLSS
jgi:hypothetical protein